MTDIIIGMTQRKLH